MGGGATDTKESPTSPPEPWSAISQGERTLYEILFYSQGPVDGYILGEGVRELLLKSGLSLTVLSQIWNLADVSNDNVLNVHEFSLVMHLIRGRMAGLVVPQTLPRILNPPKVQPLAPPPMSQQEKDAYLRVFQALDVKRTGFIDGDVATALLKSSGLSDDVITSIWDVADFGRDGRLNPEELAIAGHLVRHIKSGGSLDGPVDIFQYAPQHISPISLLARKRRVAEYQEHKQRLMSLKETRKQQSTREAKRLELVKNKIKCLEELVILLRKLGNAKEVQFDEVLSKDKEEVKKQEEIVYRLKKEHEKVRQETVKIILGEHVFNEDNRIIKAETDELNKRLLTSHSHATKDPDPFHQLYEQRKEKRQGSTIKDLDKIDIHIPFEFSPFDLAVTPGTLPSGARILKESMEPCDSGVMSVISDVKGFGEEFMTDWGGLGATTTTQSSSTPSAVSSSSSSTTPGTMSSTSTVFSSGSERKEFDDDEIFIEVEDNNHDLWPLLDGSNDGLLGLTDDQVVGLKAKLNDLRNELKQLNAGHRKLIFRNSEDYSARQRAKEAEELSERGRINRRSAAERIRNTSSGSTSVLSRSGREGSGSGVRYRVTSDRPPSETAQAVRDYRLKRRSQNLDSASASSSPDSIRRANGLSQDSVNSNRRHLSSSIGSPSVSDEASLSRQSSLSSTDRPDANTPSPANVKQQALPSSSKDNRVIEEENIRPYSSSVDKTAPSFSSTTTSSVTKPSPAATSDSSVLKLQSNRRKDELSLALGSTALGRSIHIEPVPTPPSESNKPHAIESSARNAEFSHKSAVSNVNDNVINGQITASTTKQQSSQQTTGPETQNKVSSSKKSRAPLPPTSLTAVASSQECVNKPTANLQSVKGNQIDTSVTYRSEPGNQSNAIDSSEINLPSSRPKSTPEKSKEIKLPDQEDGSSVPRRPPRIKRSSISEKRNSGSFNSDSSSFSSSQTDSFDKVPVSPSSKMNPKIPTSPTLTQETMSSTTVKSISAVPKLQTPNKKRPAPTPTAEQISEANAMRSKINGDSDNSYSKSSPANSSANSSHTIPPLNLSIVEHSKVDKPSLGDKNPSSSIDREETESPPPPPLPASPPPLPSSPPPLPSLCAPSLMQEDLNIEEEMVTVEYSSSVNFSAVALSPPTMRADRHDTSGEHTGSDNDLHLNLNDVNGDDHHLQSSDNDSDLTDSDEEDRKGKYEIFSPGDSGIMTTSSIATTPDESDSNIELVNYTPTNNDDIITNNNYMTTNFNFVNNNSNNNNNDNIIMVTTAEEVVWVHGVASFSSPSSPLRTSSTTTTNTTPLPSSRSEQLSSSHVKEPIMEPSMTSSTSHRISSHPSNSNSFPTAVNEDIIAPSVKSVPQMMAPPSASSSHPSSSSKAAITNNKTNGEEHSKENSISHNTNYTNNENKIELNENDDESGFRSSLPKWNDKSEEKPATPRNQDIMAKARHFADMVQPKQVIILKSEVISKTTNEARAMSKDPSANDVEPLLHQNSTLEDVVKQRKDIISQATTKRKPDKGVGGLQSHEEDQNEDDETKTKSSNPSDYGYTYLTPRETPVPEVGWKDREAEAKEGVINLYSQNVVKEGDTTESVDRESIANLHTTKQQWESIFSSNLKSPDEENVIASKKKPAPKWEVKLPASYNKSSGGGSSLKSESSSIKSDNNYLGIDSIDGGSKLEMEVVNNNNLYDGGNSSADSAQYEGESAIEYEIRIAREREEMLLKEKEERARIMMMPSSSSPLESTPSLTSSVGPSPTVQRSSGPMSVLSSMEAVNRESESYQPAFNELVEADRGPDVWTSMEGGLRGDNTYEIREADPNESIIEREIRQQQEKEAELERQRMMLSQTSLSPSHSSSSGPTSPIQPQHQSQQHQEPPISDDHRPEALHSPPSGRMSPVAPSSTKQYQAPPSQESIIARELRELQEREEEMRRLRTLVHGTDSAQTTETGNSPETHSPSPSPQTLNIKPANNNNNRNNNNSQNRHSLLSPSSSSSPRTAIPNSQGTWQREVSPFVTQQRRMSQDSGSSHSHSVSKASSDNIAGNTTSRSVSVQPLCDGHASDEDDKPNYFKKQETPIEREMRIAKERENELRRMKGMPELSNKDDYYGSYGENPDKTSSTGQSKPISKKTPTQQSLKKVSTSRLQQEMSAQKEREKNEGKVISDSGESIKTNRYMEVTGSQTADGSEKRNFVTKRSSTVIPPQASEMEQRPQQPVNNPSTFSPSFKASTVPSPSSAQGGGSSGGGSKKGLGGGSKNFSYKEFRQTAESKIERELREMREREEELRNQRKGNTVETPR